MHLADMGIEPPTSCIGGRNTIHYTTNRTTKMLCFQVTFTKDQLSKIPNKDQWYGLKSVKCDSEAQVNLKKLTVYFVV